MRINKLSEVSTAISLVILRLFIALEFLQSGLEKWQGKNWFTDIQSQFPFPVSLFSPEINWQLAMYGELLLPILLIFGLLTRLASLGLITITLVAWYAVHAGLGYNVCSNGYKMALIYLIMLLPLILQGAGTFSLDFLLQKKSNQ